MRSALRPIVAEQLLALVVARLHPGVEQQADAGPDRGQRRPQLVGDRREQVGPQPLQLSQGQPQLASVASRAVAERWPRLVDSTAPRRPRSR